MARHAAMCRDASDYIQGGRQCAQSLPRETYHMMVSHNPMLLPNKLGKVTYAANVHLFESIPGILDITQTCPTLNQLKEFIRVIDEDKMDELLKEISEEEVHVE